MDYVNMLLQLLLGTNSPMNAVLRLLYLIGLWKILKKSGIPGWWALVPFARDYMLARCADREAEGRVTSVTNALTSLSGAISYAFSQGQWPEWMQLFAVLTTIVMGLTHILYYIRVYNGLIEIYGVRKIWIVPWIAFDFVPSLYWGFSDKYQPKRQVEELREDALSLFTGKDVAVAGQGLTVNMKERSVWDFFRKKYLLRDIHMSIRPGSMVLLLGGSGAGKTTFLNAVNGYEKAKAKVTLDGRDIYAEYKKMQYRVGFVPQQELMRGKDTVYSTLMDAALLRLPLEIPMQDLKKRVEDVMEVFGLKPVRNSLVEKLSGGQKKRLSISMEFISNPSLFILDEPDSGLDGVMARELMQQLRSIADQGKIIIVITHTPDRVIDLFDDVIVLAKDSHRTGRLAFYGTVEEARKFFGKQRMEEIVMSVNRKEEGGEGLADDFIMKYGEVRNG